MTEAFAAKRCVATVLAAALILVSPGPLAYEALAQTRSAPMGARWSLQAPGASTTRTAPPSGVTAPGGVTLAQGAGLLPHDTVSGYRADALGRPRWLSRIDAALSLAQPARQAVAAHRPSGFGSPGASNALGPAPTRSVPATWNSLSVLSGALAPAGEPAAASAIGQSLDLPAHLASFRRLGKYDALAGTLLPILSGLAVGALVSAFGVAAYAYAYGLYSALLLGAIPFYWAMVRDPRDPSTLRFKSLSGLLLATALATAASAWRLLALARLAPSCSPLAPCQGLGRRSPASGAPGLARRAFKQRERVSGERVPWKERLARRFDRTEALQGLAYILRNKTLSVLMAVGAVESFLADAMPMVVLPNFITEVIGASNIRLPLIGPLFATAGGIFGLMLAAEHLGKFLSSLLLEGERGDRLIERWGYGRFYRLAAAGSLLFWLMWLFPAFLTPGMFWANLCIVLLVQFAVQFLHAPVGIVMAPVQREQIPEPMLGRVAGAFTWVNLIAMAAGALAAGLMIDLLPLHAAMLLIAIAITGTAVMEWMAPRWIFPDGKGPDRGE